MCNFKAEKTDVVNDVLHTQQIFHYTYIYIYMYFEGVVFGVEFSCVQQ